MIDNPFNEIILGEKFPLKKYIQSGDFSTVMLTASGFDVIISLTDITEQEKYAIADEAFDIYILDTDFGPFMVFKFGETFKCDLSINILKMKQEYLSDWLKNPEETIHIYVLESNNSIVKAVRFVPFAKMYDLKVSCMRQLSKDKANVDAFIQNVYARYSIPDLIRSAQYHFTVPATEISLS